MSPNIRNNNCRVERWANCVSCGPITVNKEKADKEIIMLSCFHVVCAGECYESVFDHKNGKI